VKRWLEEPVTRADVFGWVLLGGLWVWCIPVVINVPPFAPLLAKSVQQHPDASSPFLNFCIGAGAGGLRAFFGACMLLPLAALATRQRPVIRVLTPLVCGALAYAFTRQFTAHAQQCLDTIRLVYK
jgi:hypothetical protein